MRKAVLYGAIRLVAAAQAVKPVLHVGWIRVGDEWKWAVSLFDGSVQNALRPRQGMQLLAVERDFLLGAMDERIGFVISFLFHQYPTLASFASDIDECGLAPHNPHKAICVITEAGRVTHQKSLRVLEHRLEGIGIFAAILPCEDAPERGDRLREMIFQ